MDKETPQDLSIQLDIQNRIEEENILAQEDDLGSIENPITGEQIDLNQRVNFKHDNGLEISGRLGEVLSDKATVLCPALGRMAMIDRVQTYKSQDMADRIAEKGRLKREAEERAKSNDDSKEKPEKETSNILDKNTTTPTDKPSEIDKYQEIETALKFEEAKNVIDSIIIIKNAEEIEKDKIITPIKNQIPFEEITAQSGVVEKIKLNNPKSNLINSNNSEVIILDTENSNGGVDIQSSKSKPVLPANIITHQESNKRENKVNEAVQIKKEKVLKVDEKLKDETTHQKIPIVEKEPRTEKADINTTKDTKDTVELFDQTVGVGEVDELPSQQLELLEDEQIKVNDNPNKLPNTIPVTFEEYIEAQPKPGYRTSLETIKSNVNEQSLEETFIQLVNYFEAFEKENTPNVKSDKINEDENIRELLQDIHKELSVSIENKDFYESPKLTPEVTQKLLLLLRVLGYQNPNEVLVDFVTKHDIEYLLQAIRYFYQLTNEDNQQEFLKKVTPFYMVNNQVSEVGLNIGKFIMDLVKPKKEATVLVTAD